MVHARLLFRQIDGVLIATVGMGVLTDEGLEAWARAFLAPGVTAYVVVVAGQLQVTPVQRSIVANTLRQRDFPMAAATDSAVVRGLITALRWLGVSRVRTYSLRELPDLFLTMGRSKEIVGECLDAVRTLMRELEGEAA